MATSDRLTVIRPTTVVSPTAGPHNDWVVITDHGVISYAGPAAKAPSIPEGARIVDGEGCSLMPGWIDGHTHMFGGATAAGFDARRQIMNGVRSCWRAVTSGLTSVVDLGCRTHDIFSFRASAEEGLFVAPRMFLAGQAICMTGGHGTGKISVEADGIDGVRRAVRSQVGAGADVIKLMATGGAGSQYEMQGGPQLTVEELAAGVVEARKAGRMPTTHATSAEGIMNAIEAGVTVIQHGTGLDDRCAAELVKRSGVVVPTMSVGRRSTDGSFPIPEYWRRKSKESEKAHFDGIETALSHGVTIGFGTDSGGEYHPVGDTALETEMLTDLGMKPLEIVAAATINNARWLGVSDRIGDIATGMEADLLLVRGDAATDAQALSAVKHVWVRGQQVVADGVPIAGPFEAVNP